MIKKLLFTSLAVFMSVVQSFGQCAMCRTTIENNVSNGELRLAEGLNFGILYLFAAPYLAIAAVAFFWYRASRANARKKQHSSYSSL